MARMKQAVTVNSGNAATVGIVAVVALTLAAMLSIVAMFMITMGVLAVVGGIALSVYSTMRYARYTAETQAALHLWRRQVQVDAARAGTPELGQAILRELDAPPKPRVALAMRRLTSSRPDVATFVTPQRQNAWWGARR